MLSKEHRALTLGLVSIVFLTAFTATAVNTAMPVVARELNGIHLYAFAFSAYFTTSLFGLVVAGEWADRRGPFAVMSLGIASFVVGLVLAGAAVNMEMFIAARAVQGLGAGIVAIAQYAVISRAYRRALHPSIFAASATSWLLPSLVGPLIAGSVTQLLSWRWVFLGIPVLIIVPIALTMPRIQHISRNTAKPLPDRQPALSRRRIQYALTIALGAGLLQYGGQHLRPLSAAYFVAGLALLVPSVLKILPAGTARAARGLPSVVLLRGVAAGSFTSAESFVPLMLVMLRGLTPTVAGLCVATTGAAWALGSFCQSRPCAEPHRERLVRLGMLLLPTAILGASAVLTPSVPVWVAPLAWIFGSFGMGLVMPSTGVLTLRLSTPEEAGSNAASMQLCAVLAQTLLLTASGAVFTALAYGVEANPAQQTAAARPAAFLGVFLPVAGTALFGRWVAGRLSPVGPSLQS